MKYFLVILLIGCSATRTTTTVKTVILDATKSRVINGNCKGYFKVFNWRQIQGKVFPIENPALVKTYVKVEKGSYAWEIVGIDNLGNIGKDTVYFKF
jgi:hypothetical protein